MSAVKLVECPRDAWQSLPEMIPAHVKVSYLQSLFRAGFRTLDAASFVSPSAVPQMADSEEVLTELGDDEGQPVPADANILAIVVNERGVERAIANNLVRTLGFPYSVSSTFLWRNQRQTPEQSVDVLERALEQAANNGLDVCAYVSMAFGNPYGDAWSAADTVDAVDMLTDLGVNQISLADTVGLASADDVARLTSAVLEADFGAEIGVHLHAAPADAAGKVLAAYNAGCRRFDTAIAGMGGCPFAQDALVGNIATETALATLQQAGAELPAITGLDTLVRAAQGIATRFGSAARVQ